MKYLFLMLFFLLSLTFTASADVPKHRYTQRQAARASRRVEAHHARERVKTQRWLQRQRKRRHAR